MEGTAQTLLGGSLIGAASALLLRTHGKIFGVSGLVKSCADDGTSQAVIGGILLGGGTLYIVNGPSSFDWTHAAGTAPAVYFVSGLLVGVGTTLGAGCTSGHGVCGLGRFSKRSLAAVLSFMATGFLTATFASRVDAMLLHSWTFPAIPNVPYPGQTTLALGAALVASSKVLFPKTKGNLWAAASGAIFATGLTLAGMTNPNKILAFLDLSSFAKWNPSVMLVMLSALAITVPAYATFSHRPTLCTNTPPTLPDTTKITPRLIVGSAIFGVGWGLGGLCPGPALVSLASGAPAVVLWLTTFTVGAFATKALFH